MVNFEELIINEIREIFKYLKQLSSWKKKTEQWLPRTERQGKWGLMFNGYRV